MTDAINNRSNVARTVPAFDRPPVGVVGNKRASFDAPKDVMERKATSQAAQAPAAGNAAAVGNILQDLLGSAGEVVGAVANGLKGLVDAATGFLGIVGNSLSKLIGLLG